MFNLTIIKVEFVKVHSFDKIAQRLWLKACYFWIAKAVECVEISTSQSG